MWPTRACVRLPQLMAPAWRAWRLARPRRSPMSAAPGVALVIDWRKTALTSVYAAAAMSFGAGILRDWQLVHHVPDYQAVFGAMYTVALAASFSVNAVTLGRGFHRHPLRLWILVGVSLVLFLLLVRLWQPMATSMFWWMLPVPVLYVIGALHARRLLDAGHVLVGRLRDGVSSLFVVILVAVGLGAESFPIAVLIGSALIAFAAHKLLDKAASPLEPDVEVMRWRHYVGAIFYANIATVLVNAWALWANNLDGTVFGVTTPVAVRVAVYVFQLFSLPSVLLPRWKGAHIDPTTLRWLAWLCIAMAVGAANLPIQWSIVLLPCCALAALYTSVLLMHCRKAAG